MFAAIGLLSLYQPHHVYSHPTVSLKDFVDAMKLFVLFSECDNFSPIEPNFEMPQSWIFRNNIHDSKCKHDIHVHSTWELDHVFAVILMLLLMSGDIELNPGPKDRRVSSNSPSSDSPPTDHDALAADAEKRNSDMPEPGSEQQFPNAIQTVNKTPTKVCGNTFESPHRDSQTSFESPEIVDRLTINSNVDEPMKALSMATPAELNSSDHSEVNEVSHTSNLNDHRKVDPIHTHDSQPKTTSNVTFKSFETQPDRYYENDRQDTDPRSSIAAQPKEGAIVQPKEQTSVHTYVVFTPTSHHTKYAMSEQEQQEEPQEEPPQELEDDQQVELEDELQEELVHPLQEAPDFFEVERCYPSDDEFAACLNEQLRLESHKFEDSFAKHELDDCTSRFFSLANRLYRAGCPCNYCSLCGGYKKDEPRDSHVFPEGLLRVFRRIHCYNSKTSSVTKSKHDIVPKNYAEFIYDFVLDKRFGTSAWTYDLLCGTCEQKCSVAEGKLRSVYIRMMRSVDLQPCVLLNEDIWFNYILAMIMLRGLLVSEKLSFTSTRFNRGFTELWNFCKSDPESFIAVPDLRLFLLPNRAINETMMAFLYSFEYSLRCPMFTRHISTTKNGEFLYWKFDCFHVILTLDDTSEKYFEQYQHILRECLEKRQLTLQWTDTCSTITHTSANAIKIEYNDNSAHRLFPPALFEENIALNNEFVKRICDQASVRGFQSNLLPSCKIMTNRYRGLGHQYPLVDSDVSLAKTHSTSPLSYTEIDFNVKKDDEYIEEAIRLSPLRFPERIAELQRISALDFAMRDNLKLTDAKKVVELEEELSEVKKKQKEDKDKYKSKQKKSGDMVVKLKQSLDKSDIALQNEKEKVIKESLRAEKEARRAEEAMSKADQLQVEKMELKKRICKCNKMMLLKELRLINKQQELKEQESVNMQTARTVLNLCIEVMQCNGVSLGPGLSKLCQGFIESDQKSPNYANLEYLDLPFPAEGKYNHKTWNSIEVQRTVSC